MFLVHVAILLVSLQLRLGDANPGQPCNPLNPTQFCKDSLTICRKDEWDDFTCMCIDDFFEVNGMCEPLPIFPGDKCDNFVADCSSIPHAACMSGTCSCTSGYQHDTVNRRCLKIPTKPGDLCEPNSVHCSLVEGTICAFLPELGDSICECLSPDEVTDIPNGICLRKPTKPGDPCTLNLTPCTAVINTTCSSEGGGAPPTCRCVPDLVTNPVEGKCVIKPTKPGETCDLTYTPCDLVPMTTCVSHPDLTSLICSCRDDVTDYINHECLKVPHFPGESCHPYFTPCLLDPPHLPTECTRHSDGSFYCKCGEGSVTDFEGRRCLPLPLSPGDECSPLAPCDSIPHASCVEKVCVCAEGFVHDATGKRCIIPPQIPGDPCEPSLAPCSSVTNTSCIPDPTDPTRHSCWCTGSQVTDQGRCFLPPTKPSHSCSPTQEEGSCPPSTATTCKLHLSPENNYRCLCSSHGYFTDFILERCLPDPTKPGDPCDPLQDSHCPLNSECTGIGSQGNICECAEGFFFSTNQQCIPLPSKPSDFCESDTHCAGVEGTLCVQSMCGCVPGEYLVEEPCETSDQCSKLPLTSCVGGVCGCNAPSFPSEAKGTCLLPVRDLNLPCVETPQCLRGIGEGAVCEDVEALCLCSCGFGFIPSATGKECLKDWNPEQRCSESSQCRLVLGEFSICDTEGRCVCRDDAVLVGEFCLPKKRVGESCASSVECLLGANGFGVCSSGVCACRREVSYEEGGECRERLRLGSPCFTDLQCVRGLNNTRVICHPTSKTCACPVSFPPGLCASDGVALFSVLPLIVYLFILVIFNMHS